MISGELAQDDASGFVPYRTSWRLAGRRLLAPFAARLEQISAPKRSA